jgi:hypothetical protein
MDNADMGCYIAKQSDVFPAPESLFVFTRQQPTNLYMTVGLSTCRTCFQQEFQWYVKLIGPHESLQFAN